MMPAYARGPSAATAARSAAIAAAERKPQERAPQPWRRVPRRDTRAADVDLDAYGFDDGDDDDNEPRFPAGTETQRSQREQKKWDAFGERRERATSNLLLSAAGAAAFRAELRRQAQELLQEYIDCAATRHCCYVQGLTGEPPTVVGTFRVKVQDMKTWYEATVPRLCCAACGTWDVQAEECDCFPASPTDPQLWFMVPVLEFFNQLLLRNGQSAEGAARRGVTLLSTYVHHFAQALMERWRSWLVEQPTKSRSATRTWSTFGVLPALRRLRAHALTPLRALTPLHAQGLGVPAHTAGAARKRHAHGRVRVLPSVFQPG